MVACPEHLLHAPKAPNMIRWPFDTPWIVRELRVRGLTVVNAGSLNPAEIFSATGERWMDRALAAEAHLRDAVKIHEQFLKMSPLVD